MASISFPHSPISLSPKPFSLTRTIKPNTNTKICSKTLAMIRENHNHDHNHNHNYYGRLVDENLIVLRKRIHETKMMEGSYEPPTTWMDWEKRFYVSNIYDSIICDAMGLLQSYLMKIRPSMALAMIALIALSLPTSTALAMFHLLQLSKGVLSGIYHLS